MANEALHAAIRKKFGLTHREDNLPHGSGRRYHRDRLASLFAEIGFTRGAEIGVRRGRFSGVLCKANPNLHLFCVDPWSAYTNKYYQARQDRIYAEAVNRLTPDRATLIRKSSMNALADFEDGSLDFVFIDGDHSYEGVKADITAWWPKMVRGGIFSGHDYREERGYGVKQAVDEFVAEKGLELRLGGNHCWFVTR